MQWLKRHITVLEGVNPYDRSFLGTDLLAGVTLAALAIPEVMGYARIAGTPVITGLYTILLPTLAFALLGSSRHLVVGGDSATAAILAAGLAGLSTAGVVPGSPQWLGLAGGAALITGVLLLLARLARLGFLANFISRTVLVGFLTGVGIQVAAGQVAGMLGVPSPQLGSTVGSGTVQKLWDTLKEIGSAHGTTVLVTVAVLATVVIFDRFGRRVPGGLVAVVGTIAVSWIGNLAAHGVAILGPVPSGLPHLGLPYDFGVAQIPELLGMSASMFLVILAQSAATSRAYAVTRQEQFDENTDLVGLSVANIAAGLSGTFMVNGSPTKTEIVADAGGRTQVAQMGMVGVVAIVLVFLTGPLQYLPEATLSAVVFVIGLKLVDVAHMREIWRLRRDEFWVAAATALVVIAVGVEQGIILAIVFSLLLHVRRHYNPHDSVVTIDASGQVRLRPVTAGMQTAPGFVAFRPGVGIFYANAAHVATDILKSADVPEPPRWIVLIADAVDDIDYTGGKTLLEVAAQLHKRNIVFAIAQADPEVCAELERFGIIAAIGKEHVFDTALDARRAFEAG